MCGEIKELTRDFEINSGVKTIQSNSTSDFINLYSQPFGYNKIKPMSVTLPFYWFAVDDENNKVYFDNSGTQTIATLSNKSYFAGADLATDLQSALNTADATISATVTYNTSTNTFTIASTSAIKMLWATAKTAGYYSYALLGFNASDEGTALTTRNGPNVARLEKYNHVYVLSNVLASGLINRPYYAGKEDSDNVLGNSNSVIFKLPIKGMPYDTMVYDKDNLPDMLYYGSDMIISNIDIQLLSPYGNVIDLNGANWSINMRAYSNK